MSKAWDTSVCILTALYNLVCMIIVCEHRYLSPCAESHVAVYLLALVTLIYFCG